MLRRFMINVVSRIGRRVRRSRPGSVLILVVALLVIMALIGTALVSTARTDRYVSAQHATNTQVDMLLEGLINLVQGQIVDDLFGNVGNTKYYRPPKYNGSPFIGYEHYDSYFEVSATEGDPWMAARVPDYTTIAGVKTPYWPAVSKWLAGTEFESPQATAASPNTVRLTLTPTVRVMADGTKYPAWKTNLSAPDDTIIAADADGDGIADSSLWPLPIGEIGDVKYYAAYRVIDNNSALNANTAWSSKYEYTWSATEATPPGGYCFFPGNIGLLETLSDYSTAPTDTYQNRSLDMSGVNWWRFQQTSFSASPPPRPWIADDLNRQSPYPDWGTSVVFRRNDVLFLDQQNAVNSQIGRRLDNPAPSATGGIFFRSLTVADSVALAYRFIHKNKIASPAQIEKQPLTTPNTLKGQGGLYNTVYANSWINAPGSYVPGQEVQWFSDQFDYDSEVLGTPNTMRPKRSLIVARNPVANLVPVPWREQNPNNYTDTTYLNPTPPNPPAAYTSPAVINPGMAKYRASPSKTNINTAQFDELWRAFWCVMCDTGLTIPPESTGTPGTPVAYNAAAPSGSFRSPLRGPAGSAALLSNEVMQIRAALAAVNTIDLRDSENITSGVAPANSGGDVTGREINIYTDPTNPTTVKYKVRVYGTERSAFFTEAIIKGVGGDYIGLEIYNPHPTQALTLTNWHLACIDRSTYATGLTLTDLGELGALFPAGIPANGYVVLENDDATRPATMTPPVGTPVKLPALASAFNHEIVLLRPRRADGTFTSRPTDPYDPCTESATNLAELIPLDQLDFTGIVSGGTSPQYRYARPSGTDISVSPNISHLWQCVYGGGYDPNATPRHKWMLASSNPGSLGAADSASNTAADATPTSPTGTNIFTIQLNNQDWAGFNKMNSDANNLTGVGSVSNTFPYGGFARNGDMLQIPFIGAYRIVDPVVDTAAGSFMEMNSVTMDAAFADDPDTDVSGAGNDDNANEQLGRFCPLIASVPPWNSATNYAANNMVSYNEVLYRATAANAAGGAAPPAGNWVVAQDYYSWASDLFDYLSVQAPADDYMPDVDPMKYSSNVDPPVAVGNSSSIRPPTYTYGRVVAATVSSVTPTGNFYRGSLSNFYKGYQLEFLTGNFINHICTITSSSSTPSISFTALAGTPAVGDWFRIIGSPEDTEPVHGLININSANKYLLTKIPGITATLAQNIIDYRTNSGGTPRPFKTIFDLNKVPGFRENNGSGGTMTFDSNPANDPDDAQGDYSPFGAGGDGVRNDFEERFLALNRISNLITVRSDSYTCYVDIQGWSGAGGANPKRVTERRAAFIIDRSGITATNKTPKVYQIPTD